MTRQRSNPVSDGAPELEVEARAALLVEASLPGSVDEDVARKWGVSTKTIQRLRAQVRTDQALADAVRRAWEASDPYDDIRRAIQVLTRKAVELALMVRTPKDLRAVRDLISTLGEILVTRDTLGPKQPTEAGAPDRKDPIAPADGPRA